MQSYIPLVSQLTPARSASMRRAPEAAMQPTKGLVWKAPARIKNSPMKLLVPGNLITPKVKKRKIRERIGISRIRFYSA